MDGVEVPLNSTLGTGQCVEIVTGEEATPRREWLDPALGFVHTGRARSKIQAWFRSQLAELNINAGRALLHETFDRLEMDVDIDSLAKSAGFETTDQMLLAVGVGDQHVIDLVKLEGSHERRSEQLSLLPSSGAAALPPQSITVIGADRPGLLRDIAAVLAAMNISVVGTRAFADRAEDRASISLDLAVESLLELVRAIDEIRQIADVTDVRRS